SDPKSLDAEEDEDQKNKTIEAENIEGDTEGKLEQNSVLDEFMAEDTTALLNDASSESRDRETNPENDNQQGSEQDLKHLGQDNQDGGEIEGDKGDRDTNQELDGTSSSSDVSSSFLGEYFAENGLKNSSGEEKDGTDVNEVTSSVGENQPLAIQQNSEGAGGLSTLGLAGLNSSSEDTLPVDITKSEVPFDVIQWQRSRERLVLSSLQKISYRTNQLLRTSKAIPEPLANPFIEGDLSLSRESSSKTPNLLALTIEPTKSPSLGGRPVPMRMVAVHLNLSDLELVNPELRRRSLKIRKLFSQLETLNQQHQDIQKKLNIAQADMEWRSSWSDDN
ncbi:MAG: hypothetical protein AAGA67_13520, partial [Cyanobacteria bacterium P01_F01_bin.153]